MPNLFLECFKNRQNSLSPPNIAQTRPAQAWISLISSGNDWMLIQKFIQFMYCKNKAPHTEPLCLFTFFKMSFSFILWIHAHLDGNALQELARLCLTSSSSHWKRAEKQFLGHSFLCVISLNHLPSSLWELNPTFDWSDLRNYITAVHGAISTNSAAAGGF